MKQKTIENIVAALTADLSPIMDMYLKDGWSCWLNSESCNGYSAEAFIKDELVRIVNTYGPAGGEHYLLDKEVTRILNNRIDFHEIEMKAMEVKKRAKDLREKDEVLYNYIKSL